MPQRPAPESETYPGRERRRHPRAEADWPLELQLGAVPVKARLRDVSRSGLCFFLDRPVTEMTVLSLNVAVPPGDGAAVGDGAGKRGKLPQIQAKGVVVRCEKISERVDHYEVAIFFHDIKPEDAEAIDALVREFEAR